MRKFLFVSLLVAIFASVAFAQTLEYAGSALWNGAWDVKVVDNRAYCAFYSGLMIIDISDPSNPSIISRLFCRGNNYKIAINGDYIFLASTQNGINIINVLDQSNPVLVGNIVPRGMRVNDIYVNGDYLYSAEDTAGFQIIDISNMMQPVRIGSYHLVFSSPFPAVYVDGDYAYFTCNNRPLYIINISNKTNPTLEGTYYNPEQALGFYDVVTIGD